MLAVYAIVNGNQEGWASAQTLGLLAAAVVLLAIFLWVARSGSRCSRVWLPPEPLDMSMTLDGFIASASDEVRVTDRRGM